MKKSTYFIIASIIVIVIAICLVIGNLTESQGENTLKSNTTENELNTNKIQNQESNTQANEIEEKEIENSIVEETQNKVENTVSSETFEESPKTEQEKAIQIVKKDWKGSSEVEFLADGMNENGNYRITVRNSQTTEALAFYTVDVSNQTFTKREMN